MVKPQSWNENLDFPRGNLSTWLLHRSAWATMVATSAVRCVLDLSSSLAAWNSPKAGEPCHHRPTLTEPSAWLAFCFGEHLIASLLEGKKKRTEESTWGWKGNQVYSLYWNKSNSLWMSTFVWFLLKIWLRYRLLQWPQGTNEHFIFLCCQVGWYVLSSAPNSWMWKDRFEHEWWEAFCVSCVWET